MIQGEPIGVGRVKCVNSTDMKELTVALLQPWFAIFGWLLFVLASIIYVQVNRWQKTRYEAEIARQREIIDRFLPPDEKDKFKLE